MPRKANRFVVIVEQLTRTKGAEVVHRTVESAEVARGVKKITELRLDRGYIFRIDVRQARHREKVREVDTLGRLLRMLVEEGETGVVQVEKHKRRKA